MPKHPLSKAELDQLLIIVALGAAAGFVWQTLQELANARRELRTARWDLSAEQDHREALERRVQTLQDRNGRLDAQIDSVREAVGRG